MSNSCNSFNISTNIDFHRFLSSPRDYDNIERRNLILHTTQKSPVGGVTQNFEKAMRFQTIENFFKKFRPTNRVH